MRLAFGAHICPAERGALPETVLQHARRNEVDVVLTQACMVPVRRIRNDEVRPHTQELRLAPAVY
jgi:hypothetical protein